MCVPEKVGQAVQLKQLAFDYTQHSTRRGRIIIVQLKTNC